jgi:hypothetical protein
VDTPRPSPRTNRTLTSPERQSGRVSIEADTTLLEHAGCTLVDNRRGPHEAQPARAGQGDAPPLPRTNRTSLIPPPVLIGQGDAPVVRDNSPWRARPREGRGGGARRRARGSVREARRRGEPVRPCEARREEGEAAAAALREFCARNNVLDRQRRAAAVGRRDCEARLDHVDRRLREARPAWPSPRGQSECNVFIITSSWALISRRRRAVGSARAQRSSEVAQRRRGRCWGQQYGGGGGWSLQ